MDEAATRTLHYGDNLPIMRNMEAGRFDLIYLDPPFNSNRAYNIIYPDDQGQVMAFDDTWRWTPECDVHLRTMKHPGARGLLNAFVNALGKVEICAYLVNIAVRLVEMRRILKPTGSIYLHCDDTASHYLKVLMDAVFGGENFRNDIAWKRATSHNDPRRFGRILDSILFYHNGGNAYWDGRAIAAPKTDEQLRRAYPSRDEHGRYRSDNLTGPLHGASKGVPSARPWKDYDVHAMGRCWSVPKTGHYAEYIARKFIPGYQDMEDIHERLDALDEAGLIHHPERGRWPGLKRYAEADQGHFPQNLILEPIGFTNYSARNREYLGYPTQKPVKLLEKLVLASCPPNGLVLDPFCGCGTTMAAAERLKRNWVGIDITYSAVAAIQERFRRQKLDIWGEINVLGKPETVREVDAKLINNTEAHSRKEFEKFVVSLIGGLPNAKMGADGGIDGRIPLRGDKTAICSVKSGRATVEHVRALRGLLDDQNPMGVFITRNEPTGPMLKFARESGVFDLSATMSLLSGSFPKIQILTLEQILKGERPDLPYLS